MKKALLILLILSSILSYSSEVNGKALLDNTTNHSGILIKFTPVSPSAVYAETTSDINGLYNINLANGIYTISYEKTGYQTHTSTNQLISKNKTLTDITLSSKNVVNVSGDVFGNWLNSNTYIVNSDITIPNGETLNIEEGTVIKFDGQYSLVVNGTLKAIGSQNNTILFTSNSPNQKNNDWKGIQINNLNSTSELKFCIIEYGNEKNNDQTGLIEVKGNLIIANSKIRHSNGVGVRVTYNYSGNISIKNSEIYDCTSGIYSSGSGQLIVDNNSIYGISEIGIRNWSSSKYTAITNNKINQCQYGINLVGDALVERNIIFNNSFFGLFVADGTASILNNTFLSNQNSIGITANNFYSPKAKINSNIFLNSKDFDIKSLGDFKPLLVTYNLFYNSNIGNNLPIGVGSTITTNKNGTDSDTYFNIFSSPDFISIDPSNVDFCNLNFNSDAINAGDPSITNNYNQTIIDIGANESPKTLSVNEYSNNNFVISPNPFVSNIKIQAKNKSLFNRLLLYNLNGQIIKEYKLKTLTSRHTINNLTNLKSGGYIISIFRNSNKIQQVKLIKK